MGPSYDSEEHNFRLPNCRVKRCPTWPQKVELHTFHCTLQLNIESPTLQSCAASSRKRNRMTFRGCMNIMTMRMIVVVVVMMKVEKIIQDIDHGSRCTLQKYLSWIPHYPHRINQQWNRVRLVTSLFVQVIYNCCLNIYTIYRWSSVWCCVFHDKYCLRALS